MVFRSPRGAVSFHRLCCVPTLALALSVLFAVAEPVRARAGETIRIAQQFGIAYLILDVMRDQKLIEKDAKAEGLDLTVEWASISGATSMNEALLSGSLDVVSAGVPPALTVWDRTKGKQNVKLVASLGSLPNYLITNKPAIKTLKDLGPSDRIAVPAAGVGFQSRILQIETARQFGPAAFKKFDDISISLPHPDATAALIAGGTEIDVHYSSAPFYYQALASNPAVHKILNSYDTLGGPATFNVLYATQAYHDGHAKAYKALYAALGEAASWIRSHKQEAAQVFIRQQQSKLAPELIAKIIEDPENDFTIAPQRADVYAEELFKLGLLKNRPASWKDVFFEEAWAEDGS